MLPKPDARITPSQDEFDAWCEHPVTRYVAAAWQAAAQAQRTAWMTASWIIDPLDERQMELERQRLTTRSDAYNAFLETGLERYVELNTQDQ